MAKITCTNDQNDDTLVFSFESENYVRMYDVIKTYAHVQCVSIRLQDIMADEHECAMSGDWVFKGIRVVFEEDE